MKLEEKLIHLRKEKGLTQQKVAEELGVSRQAISRWESGVVVPSTENLRYLSKLYEIPIDILINEEHDWPPCIETQPQVKRPTRKRPAWIIGILVAVVAVAITIGTIVLYNTPEVLEFDEIESEDWSDESIEEFLIEW